MPNGILDFIFEDEIILESTNKLIIGHTLDNVNVFLQLNSGIITKDKGVFFSILTIKFCKTVIFIRLFVECFN